MSQFTCRVRSSLCTCGRFESIMYKHTKETEKNMKALFYTSLQDRVHWKITAWSFIKFPYLKKNQNLIRPLGTKEKVPKETKRLPVLKYKTLFEKRKTLSITWSKQQTV
jgi:hypothetical protein